MSCNSSCRSGKIALKAGDLLLETGQRRRFVRRWIVVDQARMAERVDRRLIARAKRVLDARDDLDVDRRLDHDLSLPRARASRRPVCTTTDVATYRLQCTATDQLHQGPRPSSVAPCEVPRTTGTS